MKAISWGIALLVILFSLACHSKLVSHKTYAHQVNDHQGAPMLLGACSRESLLAAPYASWFVKNYADYRVDSGTCNQLKDRLKSKQLLLFMGTWCGDSRREIPRIFKILDYCGVNSGQIQLVMLGNSDTLYKQSPEHEERGLELHRVPDLLVYENHKEIGRIVEEPVVSLEKDLLSIVEGSGYVPSYQAVSLLGAKLQKEPPPYAESFFKDCVVVLRPVCRTASELNTYGYVKMAAGDMQKAEAAFKINILLYPTNSNVYDSMGEYYEKSGQPNRAIECYQKVLELDPGNSSAQSKLSLLQGH